jgi:hypothetical protein
MVDHVDLLLGQASPVAKLPTGTRTHPKPDTNVRFIPLTKDVCRHWHYQIQPTIDTTTRADKGWNWPRLCLLQKLTTRRHRTRGAAMLMTDPGTGSVAPIGLTLVVSPFPHLADHVRDATFLWFLSEYPAALAPNPDVLPKMIGSALLDHSLALSFSQEFHGRVGLHAAPEGGTRLTGWYSGRKMVPLPATQSLPGLRGVFLRNDGRYFIYEPKSSIDAYDLMNQWR